MYTKPIGEVKEKINKRLLDELKEFIKLLKEGK